MSAHTRINRTRNIPDKTRLYKEMHRVLKAGGTFADWSDTTLTAHGNPAPAPLRTAGMRLLTRITDSQV